MRTRGEGTTRVPTSASRESGEETALRKACANQLSMGTMFLLGRSNYFTLRIVTCVAAGLDEWHSAQNARFRSTEQAFEWVAEQHRGAFVQNLVRVFRSNLPRHLQEMGISCPTGSAGRAQAVNTRLADEEDGRAEILVDMMLALVGRRLKRSLWLLAGWMVRCVRFLKVDGGDKQRIAIAEFRRDYLLYQYCVRNPDGLAGLDMIAERAAFNLICYKQLALILEFREWRVDDDVEYFIKQHLRRIMSSQLVEDAFNKQKNTPRYTNRQGRAESCMTVLLRTQVLSTSHDYTEISTGDVFLERDKRLDWSAF